MPLEFESLRERIAEPCRRYRVRRLDVFGSAVRADFYAARSDVDFLVEFADASPQGAADSTSACVTACRRPWAARWTSWSA